MKIDYSVMTDKGMRDNNEDYAGGKVLETGSEESGKSYIKLDKQSVFQTDAKAPTEAAPAVEAAPAAEEVFEEAPATEEAPVAEEVPATETTEEAPATEATEEKAE